MYTKYEEFRGRNANIIINDELSWLDDSETLWLGQHIDINFENVPRVLIKPDEMKIVVTGTPGWVIETHDVKKPSWEEIIKKKEHTKDL